MLPNLAKQYKVNAYLGQYSHLRILLKCYMVILKNKSPIQQNN